MRQLKLVIEGPWDTLSRDLLAMDRNTGWPLCFEVALAYYGPLKERKRNCSTIYFVSAHLGD
jgi:hypothetical protein